MSSKIKSKIRLKWTTLTYNFRWSDWVTYIDGWIPKFSLFVPIVGYLLLFNDTISSHITFNILANENIQKYGFDGIERLRLIYYGLFFLGISNFIYKFRKPYIFKFGTNITEFTKNCLDTFNYERFLNIHQLIQVEGHFTADGKYDTKLWEVFTKHSDNWDVAKNQHGGLLRSILFEYFFRSDVKRKIWLFICVSFSTIGYVLLALPSIDIFIKVLLTSFK